MVQSNKIFLKCRSKWNKITHVLTLVSRWWIIGLKITFFVFMVCHLTVYKVFQASYLLAKQEGGDKKQEEVCHWFCASVLLVRTYHWLSSKEGGKTNMYFFLAFVVEAGKEKGINYCYWVNLLQVSWNEEQQIKTILPLLRFWPDFICLPGDLLTRVCCLHFLTWLLSQLLKLYSWILVIWCFNLITISINL